MDLLERIDAIQGIDAGSSSPPHDLVADGEEDISYEEIEHCQMAEFEVTRQARLRVVERGVRSVEGQWCSGALHAAESRVAAFLGNTNAGKSFLIAHLIGESGAADESRPISSRAGCSATTNGVYGFICRGAGTAENSALLLDLEGMGATRLPSLGKSSISRLISGMRGSMQLRDYEEKRYEMVKESIPRLSFVLSDVMVWVLTSHVSEHILPEVQALIRSATTGISSANPPALLLVFNSPGKSVSKEEQYLLDPDVLTGEFLSLHDTDGVLANMFDAVRCVMVPCKRQEDQFTASIRTLKREIWSALSGRITRQRMREHAPPRLTRAQWMAVFQQTVHNLNDMNFYQVDQLQKIIHFQYMNAKRAHRYFVAMYRPSSSRPDATQHFLRCRKAALKLLACMIVQDVHWSGKIAFWAKQQHVDVREMEGAVLQHHKVVDEVKELLSRIDDYTPCSAVHPLSSTESPIRCQCTMRDHGNQHISPRVIFRPTSEGTLRRLWEKYKCWKGVGIPAVWPGAHTVAGELSEFGRASLGAMIEEMRKSLRKLLLEPEGGLRSYRFTSFQHGLPRALDGSHRIAPRLVNTRARECLYCCDHHASQRLTCRHQFCHSCSSELAEQCNSREFEKVCAGPLLPFMRSRAVLCPLCQCVALRLSTSAPPLPVRMLSVSGEGDGVVQLQVLEALATMSTELHTAFDLIAGFGTGAVVVSGLCLAQGDAYDAVCLDQCGQYLTGMAQGRGQGFLSRFQSTLRAPTEGVLNDELIQRFGELPLSSFQSPHLCIATERVGCPGVHRSFEINDVDSSAASALRGWDGESCWRVVKDAMRAPAGGSGEHTALVEGSLLYEYVCRASVQTHSMDRQPVHCVVHVTDVGCGRNDGRCGADDDIPYDVSLFGETSLEHAVSLADLEPDRDFAGSWGAHVSFNHANAIAMLVTASCFVAVGDGVECLRIPGRGSQSFVVLPQHVDWRVSKFQRGFEIVVQVELYTDSRITIPCSVTKICDEDRNEHPLNDAYVCDYDIPPAVGIQSNHYVMVTVKWGHPALAYGAEETAHTASVHGFHICGSPYRVPVASQGALDVSKTNVVGVGHVTDVVVNAPLSFSICLRAEDGTPFVAAALRVTVRIESENGKQWFEAATGEERRTESGRLAVRQRTPLPSDSYDVLYEVYETGRYRMLVTVEGVAVEHPLLITAR